MKVAFKLRDRLKEETEHSILNSAEGVFAEQGLQGAKMEAIAARAGVSVGTLYNYFRDRDSLLDALTDLRADSMVTNLSAAINGEGTFQEQLRRFVVAWFREFVEHGAFLSCLHQSEHMSTSLAARRESSARTFGRLREVGRDFFERGIATRTLRGYQPEMLASFLIGICKSTLIWQERDHGTLSHDIVAPYVDSVVEFFLNGASLTPTITPPPSTEATATQATVTKAPITAITVDPDNGDAS